MALHNTGLMESITSMSILSKIQGFRDIVSKLNEISDKEGSNESIEVKGLESGVDPLELSKSERQRRWNRGSYSPEEESAIEADMSEGTNYTTEKSWRDLVGARHGNQVEFSRCPKSGGMMATKGNKSCGSFKYNNSSVNDVTGKGSVVPTTVPHDTLYTEDFGVTAGVIGGALLGAKIGKTIGIYKDAKSREATGMDKPRTPLQRLKGSFRGTSHAEYNESISDPDYGDIKLGEGDEVRVTGKVDNQGEVGQIHSSSPSGKFHIVKFKDGSKASYHHSDLSLNESIDISESSGESLKIGDEVTAIRNNEGNDQGSISGKVIHTLKSTHHGEITHQMRVSHSTHPNWSKGQLYSIDNDITDDRYHQIRVHRNESVEGLDEISKSTLGSYIKKASVDVQKQALDGAHIFHLGRKGGLDKLKVSNKRIAGIKRATDKLTEAEYVFGYFDITENLQESSPAEWIVEFVKSKDNRFYGKSITERTNIAINAFYNNKIINEIPVTSESIDEDFKAISLDELSKATLKMYIKKAVVDSVKTVLAKD